MTAHCLFEQSGKFKKEFEKLGIKAYDYDIQNEFGLTDNVCDLYSEIRGGYENKPSIFDHIAKEDVIMAFFPCTRFEQQILLGFRGEAYQQINDSDIKKLEYDLKLHGELSVNYELITKLAIIVLRKGLRMVFENPYSTQHYLTRYWCLRPQVIDKNRRERGDYFEKPTQYWFIGFEPKNNLVFEPMEYVPKRRIAGKTQIDGNSRQTSRSMIHPQYANRFIREFILGEAAGESEEQSAQMTLEDFNI